MSTEREDYTSPHPDTAALIWRKEEIAATAHSDSQWVEWPRDITTGFDTQAALNAYSASLRAPSTCIVEAAPEVVRLFKAAWDMMVEQQAGPEGWSMSKRWAGEKLRAAMVPFRTEYGDELDLAKIGAARVSSSLGGEAPAEIEYQAESRKAGREWSNPSGCTHKTYDEAVARLGVLQRGWPDSEHRIVCHTVVKTTSVLPAPAATHVS
jgi:hypothetical protein